MKYALVIEDDPMAMSALVNKKLAEGWQLQGGVSAFMHFGGVRFTQAMIYREPTAVPQEPPKPLRTKED